MKILETEYSKSFKVGFEVRDSSIIKLFQEILI